MNMSLSQAVSNLKTQQAVLNSTYNYGGGFSPGFDLGRNNQKGKLETSMGRTWRSRVGAIFNGQKDFGHAFEGSNQEYLNAANAYLTATTPEQKQTILQNLATQQGIQVDPNRDYTQEMLDIKTTLEIPRGVQTELTHRQMNNYQAHQEAYLAKINELMGVNIATAPTEQDGVVDLRTLRIKGNFDIPKDENDYLKEKIATLTRLYGEGSPELQKYKGILQNQNGTDFKTTMAAVIAQAQEDVSEATSEARESQNGVLNDKGVMIEALKPTGKYIEYGGDPEKLKTLKQKMLVLEQLQPGSDIKPRAEVARFNTNLGQAGFSWGTQNLGSNQVVRLASGADTLNDPSIKQATNGSLVRTGQEEILKEDKDTIYTQIGKKYFKKVSKYDEKTGIRRTEVQEVNDTGQVIDPRETSVYLQARSTDGKLGDLILIKSRDPKSKKGQEALKNAEEAAKKSTRQRAGQNLVPPPLNPSTTATNNNASSPTSTANVLDQKAKKREELNKELAELRNKLSTANNSVKPSIKKYIEETEAQLKAT